MKKIIIIALAVCLAVALSCFGGYILNDRVKQKEPPEQDSREDNIYKPGIINTEAEISEILVSGIQKECKILTTEIYLNCDIIVDESYYDLDVFKKRQKLTFYASALFAVDLADFSPYDIAFIKDEKIICIYIKKPHLVRIAIDNDKTVINKTENGLFRFGDIKITPENYNEIEVEAVKRMTEQTDNEEVKSLGEYNAALSVKELFLTVLSVTEYGDYDIAVEFKH